MLITLITNEKYEPFFEKGTVIEIDDDQPAKVGKLAAVKYGDYFEVVTLHDANDSAAHISPAGMGRADGYVLNAVDHDGIYHVTSVRFPVGEDAA